MKKLLLSLFCAVLLLFAAVPGRAGWLLWRAGDIVLPPAPEKEASAESIAAQLPVSAELGKEALPVELLVLGRQYQVVHMLGALNFEQVPGGWLSAVGEAVGDLMAGGASAKFPPARVLKAEGRPQSLVFARLLGKRGRLELYLWRLPWRTPGNAHAWAGVLRLSEDADCDGACPAQLSVLQKEILSSKLAEVQSLNMKKAPSAKTGPRKILLLTVKPG